MSDDGSMSLDGSRVEKWLDPGHILEQQLTNVIYCWTGGGVWENEHVGQITDLVAEQLEGWGL